MRQKDFQCDISSEHAERIGCWPLCRFYFLHSCPRKAFTHHLEIYGSCENICFWWWWWWGGWGGWINASLWPVDLCGASSSVTSTKPQCSKSLFSGFYNVAIVIIPHSKESYYIFRQTKTKLLFHHHATLFLSSLFDKREGETIPVLPPWSLETYESRFDWVRHVPLCYQTSRRFRGTCKRAAMHLHRWAHSRGNECATALCSSWAGRLFNRRRTAARPPPRRRPHQPTGILSRLHSQNSSIMFFSIDPLGFFFFLTARLSLNWQLK